MTVDNLRSEWEAFEKLFEKVSPIPLTGVNK